MADTDSPTVSVVIPFYNDVGTIERALRSVLSQTFLPLEVIVVDDHSEWGAFGSLQELCASLDGVTIRVVRGLSNRGPSYARNRGWDLAAGSWVAFLDADDSWEPGKLKNQLMLTAERPDVSLWGTEVRVVQDPNECPPLSEECAVDQIGLRTIALGNRFATSSVLIRRSVELRFDSSMRYCEDYDLWCRIIAAGAGAGLIRSPLTLAYKRPFGIAGASARLWRMEHGELRALWNLYSTNCISLSFLAYSSAFSLLRFTRRILISGLRRSTVNKNGEGSHFARIGAGS